MHCSVGYKAVLQWNSAYRAKPAHKVRVGFEPTRLIKPLVLKPVPLTNGYELLGAVYLYPYLQFKDQTLW